MLLREAFVYCMYKKRLKELTMYKRNLNSVMIDIETLGRSPYCIILSIAAVEFCLHTGKLGRKFYNRIDLADSLACGFKPDASTIQWWMMQDEKARKEVFTPDKTFGVHESLSEFSKFMKGLKKDVLVWANSPSFDCNHVAEAIRLVLGEVDPPWSYKNVRDYRTIVSMYPEVYKRKDKNLEAHHAVADCIYQIENLKLAIKGLGLSERFK